MLYFMKKYFAILVMLLGVVSVFSQETYKVISGTTYNIRTAPNMEAEIVGKTNDELLLKVYEIQNGWAKVQYGADTAYVKSDCLVMQTKTDTQKEGLVEIEEIENTKWMIFVSFCLSILLLILIVMRFKVGALQGSSYWINLSAFNLLCALEWLYMLSVGDYFLWFLFPQIVGAMFVLNAIFFSFLAIVQSISFYYTMLDFKHHYGAKFNLYFGLWSIPCVIIFSIIAGSLWGINAVVITILLFLICQIFQVLFVFKRVWATGGLVPALISSFTYIWGFVTTLIVASIFFMILLFNYLRKRGTN